ncbi:MAG TPA: Rap1a/Tai family immunity protein [Alphaproteobacteria bacterium]|nr:Rap1a/Tai family immunity protein [Alphaproteobacteria bacterium]
MKPMAVAFPILLSLGTGAAAENILDAKSADDVVPGCTRYLALLDGQGDFTDTLENSLQNGFCVGSVVGISEALLVTRFACQPKAGKASDMQAVRIVVEYVNDRPERLNERFNMLAIEALSKAWPCLKPK